MQATRGPTEEELRKLEQSIGCWPDYPIPNVVFRDVLPLFRDPKCLKVAVAWMAAQIPAECTVVFSPQSRGFLFGVPLAYELGLPFVPARKPGTTPGPLLSESYKLEYGEATLCMQAGAITRSDKVVIVDDILATGGTIEAMRRLLDQIGAECLGAVCLLDIADLTKSKSLPKTTCLFAACESGPLTRAK